MQHSISQAADKADFLAQILKVGEDYAGIIFGKKGAPDYHLILLPDQISEVDFDAYVAWIKSIEGADAPTLRELSVLFANLPEKFEKNSYWSGEQHASNTAYAWSQTFYHGYQNCYRKTTKLRGRAVRRLVIQ